MKKLKLYFSSDVHGYFFTTDYQSDQFKQMGLFYQYQHIKKDENTLLIDGGDILQGSAFASYVQKKGTSKHIAQWMNTIGYDVVTIGNHDFNYGQQYLNDYLSNLNASVVCQNVIDNSTNQSKFPYIIKQLNNGIRVGFIGIVTDFVNVWEKKDNLKGISVIDTYTAFSQCYQQVRENCDVLVVVYHGGVEVNIDTLDVLETNRENIGYQLCREFDIDLLLTGHQHVPFVNKEIYGTHIVQAPSNALGLVKVIIEIDDAYHYSISSYLVKEQGIDESVYPQDALEYQHKVQCWLDQPIAILSKELLPKSHLESALYGSEIADFINTVQLEYSNADVSVCSLANNVRGFYKTVSIRDVLTTYPFSNNLVTLKVNGKILKDALEQNFSYLILDKGKPCINESYLIPKVTHYNFDYFKGIEFTVDLNKPFGKRISNLIVNNSVIEDNQDIILALNTYRASGAGNFDMYKLGKLISISNIEMSEILIEYLIKHKNIDIAYMQNYSLNY